MSKRKKKSHTSPPIRWTSDPARLQAAQPHAGRLWSSQFTNAEDYDLHEANLEAIIFLESVGVSHKHNIILMEIVEALFALEPRLIREHNWLYVDHAGGNLEPKLALRIAKAHKRFARGEVFSANQAIRIAKKRIKDEKRESEREREPRQVVQPVTPDTPDWRDSLDQVVIEFDMDTGRTRVVEAPRGGIMVDEEMIETDFVPDIRNLDNIQDEPVVSVVAKVCTETDANHAPDDTCWDCGHLFMDHTISGCSVCVRAASAQLYGEHKAESLELAESSMPLAREALGINDPAPWKKICAAQPGAVTALDKFDECENCHHLFEEHGPFGCSGCWKASRG